MYLKEIHTDICVQYFKKIITTFEIKQFSCKWYRTPCGSLKVFSWISFSFIARGGDL